MHAGRKFPAGAEVRQDGTVHFRVWAPERHRVAVRLERRLERGSDSATETELTAEDDGYFAGTVPGAGVGARYHLMLDDDPQPYPDPVSRYQPEGPFGPSQVIDPGSFAWTDGDWRGVPPAGQVLYEMHIGTFTPEGTWAAAADQIPALADLGITVLELMPVNEFCGTFGWGYDGVNLFAPTRLYGTPDDLRRFVDRAHGHGVGVILDVVYNHLGPDGNFLKAFSKDYFTDRYKNEWGEAINFDGPDAAGSRAFFVSNAACWIDEFHMDGLRLDATQQIFDASPRHVIAEIACAVRAAGRGRSTFLVAENEPQHTRLVRPADQGGHGLDAMWNDDFHHCATVVLTGHTEAYYSDYRGMPQEFVSLAKYGFLFQGQFYTWQGKARGRPGLRLDPPHFVTFTQNHDQIANSARGLRCDKLTSPGLHRAMTALLLLGPGTPMLFMGQEFAASSPFLYFADHKPELARLVRQGRAEFLAQFPGIATPEITERLRDPADPETFAACKLDVAERERHADIYALHRDLLRLRRDDPAFAPVRRGLVDGAVLDHDCFVLRFFGPEDTDDRLLLVNFGPDRQLAPMPEPLLAPPADAAWTLTWSSEDPRYGGTGTPPLEEDRPWTLPGRSALVMGTVPRQAARDEQPEP